MCADVCVRVCVCVGALTINDNYHRHSDVTGGRGREKWTLARLYSLSIVLRSLSIMISTALFQTPVIMHLFI